MGPAMRRLLLTGGALLGVALTGCSSPASREAMAPPDLVVSQQHRHSLRVQASGGAETGGLDSSNIADADLKAAIEDAVIRSKLFQSIVQGNDGDYELHVQVVSLRRPLIGGTLNVELETGWSLVRRADRTVLLRKSIRSTGTASMAEAFAFVTRLRLAVETAARDSIRQGLLAIAELNL